MKRFLVATMLVASIALATAPLHAAGPKPPPGFGKSQYGVRVTYHSPGYVKYRYTYPGYINGFPPPAFMYYGYPQSGAGSNPGLMP
jgi:hypothetical protein